jgi:hypothetical protein
MSEPRKAPPITVSKNKRIIMLVFLTLHTGAIKRHVIDLELDIWSPRLACIFCVVTQLFFDGEHYNRGSSRSFTEAPCGGAFDSARRSRRSRSSSSRPEFELSDKQFRVDFINARLWLEDAGSVRAGALRPRVASP